MKRIMFGLLLIVLAACTPATPSANMVETAIAQTAAAQPSATGTPFPTDTLEPSATIDPFELTKAANQTQNAAHNATANANATNLALTPTKTPTWTPRPSSTPTPVPTMAPIVLSGSGDAVVDANLPGNFVGIVHITGNAGGQYFGVKNLDINNNQIDLLVNTTDPYDGVRPLNFIDGEETFRFEVTASGEWTIEILPLSSLERLNVPGTLSGTGDYVFAVSGDDPDTAIITGNANNAYFGVFAYSATRDLLVNTTDAYSGTVLVDPGTIVIEVIAEGEWTIEITSR